MTSWLDPVRHWLASLHSLRAGRNPELSRLIVGSTGSGKSEGELVDLMRIAESRQSALVLLDGHGPLALHAAGHWTVQGHEERLIFEPLRATARVLCGP